MLFLITDEETESQAKDSKAACQAFLGEKVRPCIKIKERTQDGRKERRKAGRKGKRKEGGREEDD